MSVYKAKCIIFSKCTWQLVIGSENKSPLKRQMLGKKLGIDCANYRGSFPHAPCRVLERLQHGTAPPTSPCHRLSGWGKAVGKGVSPCDACGTRTQNQALGSTAHLCMCLMAGSAVPVSFLACPSSLFLQTSSSSDIKISPQNLIH